MGNKKGNKEVGDKEVDPKWLGQWLRAIRAENNWTQKDLAEKTGVPYGTVLDIEQGRRIPGWALVVQICSALDVSPEQFVQDPGRTQGEE